MKILVTGGAGFIGSNVVDRYIALGHEVIIVDNLSTGKRENINPAAKFYEIDIRDSELEEVFSKEKPEIINHHAAQMDVRVSVEDPIYDNSVNIVGLINIMENCVKHGVKKVLFASSGGVIYGETSHLPCTEDLPKRPLSPYGISKWASELYLEYYAETYGIKYVALRYSNVYGPRQIGGEAGVVAIFINRLLREQPCYIYGDGTQLRDYVYVGDVAEANVSALEMGENIGINIGTSKPTSVNELYRYLCELLSSDMEPIYKPQRTGELYKNYLDNSLAYKILKWSPKVDLREGLGKTIEFFRRSINEKESISYS